MFFWQNFGVLKILKNQNCEIKQKGKIKLNIHQGAILELSLGT
jgi:hypothetical protein